METFLFEFNKNIFGQDQLGFINLFQQTLDSNPCVLRAVIEKHFNQQNPTLEITSINKSPKLLINTVLSTCIKELQNVSNNGTK
mgnify:CR=1 FL=1|jgi:hypothetical protein